MGNNRPSNFSDLIQRVAASCLMHPLADRRRESSQISTTDSSDKDEDVNDLDDECHEEEGGGGGVDEDKDRVEESGDCGEARREVRSAMAVVEMETIMSEVFEAVPGMKKAYLSLQEAHCPWDPEKMREADVVVVGELRRLAVLRERFRRRVCRGGRGRGAGKTYVATAATMREVVAPYEAAMEELKREVKAKSVEVENLKEKLSKATASAATLGGRKGRCQRNQNLSNSQNQDARTHNALIAVAAGPEAELFVATIRQVREASKSFTALLLSLMRSAHWDIAAACGEATAVASESNINVGSHHAKYALESYLYANIFQGFDHENFHMDGSLSALTRTDQFRRDCYAQYRDMQVMDPAVLLGILPTCPFGNFCCKKYLSIVHPKMEESLFGDLEQRSRLVAGKHPRSEFYGAFLGLAKAVWLLHLLAFSLDPAPTLFQASRGAEFHPLYMESVVKVVGRRRRRPAGEGQVVLFPVSPGFKLGKGLGIRARVYVVSSRTLD